MKMDMFYGARQKLPDWVTSVVGMVLPHHGFLKASFAISEITSAEVTGVWMNSTQYGRRSTKLDG